MMRIRISDLNLEGRLQPADIGWLAAAAAMFMLFIGMMYMLFFSPAAAWADDENPNIRSESRRASSTGRHRLACGGSGDVHAVYRYDVHAVLQPRGCLGG